MRMACYPVLVAMMVIGFMLFVLTQYVLISALIYGNKLSIVAVIAFCYFTVLALILNNYIFRIKYSGKDI
jgi:hypothetical protein